MFSGQVEFERTEQNSLCQQFEYQADDFQLRQPIPEDTEELFALVDLNRTRLRAWLPWLDSNRREQDSRAFIQQAQMRAQDNNGFATLICIEKVCGERGNPEIAGVIGLHGVNWSDRTAAIGYWISKPHEGKGLITRACAAIVTYAFTQLNLNRIEILCATQNARSQAVPQRLGFTHEGTLRQAVYLYGQYFDHDLYALLRQDCHPSERDE